MKQEALLLAISMCSLSLFAEEQHISLKLPKPDIPAQFIKEYNNAIESASLNEAINALNCAAALSTVLIVPDNKKKNTEINQPSKSSLDIISR